MPIKDFTCLDCNKNFDFFKKTKNPEPLTPCPYCESVATVEIKVIGKTSFILCGDSWESKGGY
jgi:putative FmdB family regulatory protein